MTRDGRAVRFTGAMRPPRPPRGRAVLTPEQREVDARLAPAYRLAAWLGPLAVVGLMTAAILALTPWLPEGVLLTSLGRGGRDHVVPRGLVWAYALSGPGPLALLTWVAMGAGTSNAEKAMREQPGLSWSGVAAVGWGLPMLAAGVPLADVLSQVGRPTAAGPNGWIFLAPVAALLLGWLVRAPYRRRVGQVRVEPYDDHDAPHRPRPR